MPSVVDGDRGLIDRMAPRLIREERLVERVVCIGGHAGCGKSLMTPIVGSLARVEAQKYNYVIEHLACLAHFGKIDEDAASVMLRMVTDVDLYNMMMSREVNFRFSDLSSVFKNPNPWRYIARLFQPGDAAAVERLKATRPILNYLTHNVLVLSPPLFRALGDRLRIVEVVRHPLYMIKQWHLYIERFGTDARDFTIWFEHEGRALPFWASGWEERYLRANPMDRVIFALDHLAAWAKTVMASCSEAHRSQILTIPFERFVLDPWPYLRRLESLLDTSVTARTRRELKRQHVPRHMIAEGIAEPIYKQYGWEPPNLGADERRELDNRRRFAAQHASPEGLEVLDRISAEYEAAHLSGIIR